MSDLQHIDEIHVPDIEIEKGWAVSEIETIDDCDDAFAILMSAVAQIEDQLDRHDLGVLEMPNGRYVSAKTALKYKKAALQLVNHKRGAITKKEKVAEHQNRNRALLDLIREDVGQSKFKEWVNLVEYQRQEAS